MPRYNRDRMTLNTVGFQPAVFNPMEYKPIEQDFSILERAMAKQEERQEKAMQQKTAVDVALGKVETELNPAEFEWFNAEKQRIKDRINDAVQVGDYAGAINTAMEEVGNIQSNTEWLGRLKNSAEYNQKMNNIDDMVAKGIISSNEGKYLKKKNPYSNKIVRDDNGNAIGTDTWDYELTPLANINIDNLFDEAFKSIHPDTISIDNATNLQGGTPSKQAGRAIYGRPNGTIIVPSNVTERHGFSTKEVKPQEVLAQAREKLINIPDWDKKLQQMWGGDYEAFLDDEAKLKTLDPNSQEYKALETTVNMRKPLFYDGNVPKKEDNNTFMNYFKYRLFNSKQASAYGYKYEDSNNSYVYSQPSSSDSTVDAALKAEAGTRTQDSKPVKQNNTVNTTSWGGAIF